MANTIKVLYTQIEQDIGVLFTQTNRASEDRAAEQLEKDVRLLKGLLELQHIKFDKTGDITEILKAARRRPCRQTNA